MASKRALRLTLACASGLLALVPGCAHRMDGPEPSLEGGLDPHIVCNAFEPGTAVMVAGAGLSPMPVDTALEPARLELPRLWLSRSSRLDGTPASGLEVELGEEVHAGQVRWYDGGRMSFEVIPDLDLAEGIYSLRVRNPNGHEATLAPALAVVPPPEAVTVEPPAICVEQGEVVVTLGGAGFLVVDGVRPTVTVRLGDEEHVYPARSAEGCEPLPAPATETERCTGLTFVVPEGDLSPGSYEITVTNPEPAACASSVAVTLEVVPPPDLRAVVPSRLCTTGGVIGLEGSGFLDGATVEVSGLQAESVVVEAGGERATASFGEGLLPGTHAVTIANASGCSDTLEAAVEVIQGPIVFWVDPPVVYDGISTQVTIYGSGLTGAVVAVELVPVGGGAAIALDFVHDVARGRIQAVVPAGTPPGDYDVRVSDEECPAVLPTGLVVTDTLGLTLTSIDPPYGWAEVRSPVAIFGSGFASTPRAYLNPDAPTPETLATALSSVAFVDGSRLTAVVPPGLPVGVYDLIVVNSTGEVGLLEDAFTVTAEEPPSIDGVSPGEVASGSVRSIDARGSAFRSPEASWLCVARDGRTSTPAGSVSASTGETARVSLDATSLSGGTICVLRLTNPDGAFAEFSAVAVTNPSSNIQSFRPGTDMTTARRGLSLVAGRPTTAARFLFALGGDAGAEGEALESSESAPVDLFGEMGSWFEQPNGLPGPRTLAQAVTIGRFVYLVGGSDGRGALAEVFRAEVLDPADAPTMGDISVALGEEGAGLGSGVWYYRVSALYPSDHPTNPGGEGLSSDPLVVSLPAGLPYSLVLTLGWSEVEGAVAYRVYRSPRPDMASGEERLLVEVPATAAREIVDDGSVVPAGASALPLGAHGTWVGLPSLGTPRAGHGLGHAVLGADPAVHYLYAIGGVDDSGGALGTHEVLSITVASPVDQTVAASWVEGAAALSLPRSQLGVYSVGPEVSPRMPPGSVYLYAIGGLDAGGSAVGVAEAALVGADGQLGPFLAVDTARARAGFAHVAAGNFLYQMGGGPAATTAAFSAEICGADLSCTGEPDDPPDLRNWNNEGGASLSPARYLPGSTLESAFIYVVGGLDARGVALASTQQTVW